MATLQYIYRQSTDPMLKHLWVVFEKTIRGNASTPIAVVNGEQEAKVIARDYFIELVKLKVGAIIGSTNIHHVGIYAGNEFTHGSTVIGTVAKYFRAHMIDLSTFTTLIGKCGKFQKEIRKVTRPYLPIADNKYDELMKSNHDYYLSAGGTVMTFGRASCEAGYQYAMMPLMEEHAKTILNAQPENLVVIS
jgi:hypothetical protein